MFCKINKECEKMNDLNPEDFIAWLITQPNAQGKLYLTNVAKQYAYAIRSAPKKLKLDIDFDQRSVYACHTIDKFSVLFELFKNADNYKNVNKNTSGMFSAGLKCYARYLVYLSNNVVNINNEVYAMTENIDRIKSPTQCEQDFKDWMISRGKSENTAGQYATILHRTLVSTLKANMKVKVNLFEYTTIATFSSINTTLRSLPEFVDINSYKHNSFSAALNAYNQFLQARDGGDSILVKTVIPKINNDVSCISNLSDDEKSAIEIVLNEKFSNGFNYTSQIQIGRIKKFVAEFLNVEKLNCPDEVIIHYIKQCGTEFDGKVYIVSAKVKNDIRTFIDTYFSNGANVIFYEAFFEKHESLLMESGIVSEELLINVLHSLYFQLNFTHTYFGKVEDTVISVVTSEILRVWRDDKVLNYSQIAERLQYIPYGRIKYALVQNGDFLINKRERGDNDGECIHISKVDITTENIIRIKRYVAESCDNIGYISLSDINLEELSEHNNELSISALHSAVYQICLNGYNGDYNRRGKIITRKGENIDALYIMEKICSRRERITLDELLALEVELTGEKHRTIPMQAAYKILVRISEQSFIADKYLDFDINKIDNAIENFFKSREYLPLKSITTFALFPHCGQEWNLFLLESYVYRFSNNFRLDRRAVNSQNIGAIVRKNSKLTYDEIMADFCERANVELETSLILNYLSENGLISQRKHKDIDSLIKQIKIIREMRN